MSKPSSVNYRVDDDDNFTCDTGAAITLKTSNLDPFRFVDSELSDHVMALSANGEDKKAKVLHQCCQQFKSLLPYAEFQNVKKDLETLSTLSDRNYSRQRRKSEAGHLFKDYKPKQLDEPSSYPNAFAGLTTRRRFWWKVSTTPKDRLKRMTRRFRKSIVKAADLGATVMVAGVMHGYWLVFLLQLEGGEETNEDIDNL